MIKQAVGGVVLLLSSTTAFAQLFSGVYGDVAVGLNNYKLHGDVDSAANNPFGMRVSAGTYIVPEMLGVEVLAQTFGKATASAQVSSPANNGDTYTIDADASAYDVGLGARGWWPIFGNFELGGRAGVHYWSAKTNENLTFRSAFGQTTPVTAAVNLGGQTYGGGGVSDSGIDGYVCLNVNYRWFGGLYAGAEYGYFPMSMSGKRMTNAQSFALIVGYAP